MSEEICCSLADVQSSADDRQIAIDKVGVKGIRHPIRIRDKNAEELNTVATFNMFVFLPHNFKGTHMSRFVSIINEQEKYISVESFKNMLPDMLKRLEAEAGIIEMSFPYFVKKKAPVSGVESYMDYEVQFTAERTHDETLMKLRVVVPVTSLCPCSKEISQYGAHNQRSHITIHATLDESKSTLWIEDVLRMAEDSASCELYGLLKRVDEKHVTEKAYDNPKFVEDIVRDVALLLKREERIKTFVVEAENFESIHNHSAYALIQG